MLRILACIRDQHDPRLVLAAIFVCLLSCGTGLMLASRAHRRSRLARELWSAAAAFVGGSGIWLMYFIAMLAFRPGLPIGFDPGRTAMSILAAIVGMRIAFAFRLQQKPILAGSLGGLSIATMHFIGMTAIEIQARPEWDPIWVAVAIAVGVVASAAGCKVARGPSPAHMALSAFLLVVAVVGMHFIAMAAVVFVPDPSLPLPAHPAASGWLVPLAIATAALIVALGFVGSVVDLRRAIQAKREAARLRSYVVELEETRGALESALIAAEAANGAKTRFMATVSHELRTPLNAIIGFASLMQKGVFGPLGAPQYEDYARDIEESGAHLLAMITDILELTRIDSGFVDLLEDNLAASEAVELAQRTAQTLAIDAGVTLEASAEPGLPLLRTDVRRLSHMLGHLLSNAIKFTRPGGKVSLHAFERDWEICFAVTDTGIGIASNHLATIFQPFGQVDSRLNRSFGGAGLGLAVTRNMIELQGGRLELESEPGVGTKVTLCFPRERAIARRDAA